MLRWLTSEKAKSIAAVLSAVGSVVAVIITSLKPTSAPTSQSEKAYELIREELEAQRQEVYQVHKSLVELNTWFVVWREYQAARKRNLDELREIGPAANRSSSALTEDIEVPPSPPPVPVLPSKKASLPDVTNVFKK